MIAIPSMLLQIAPQFFILFFSFSTQFQHRPNKKKKKRASHTLSSLLSIQSHHQLNKREKLLFSLFFYLLLLNEERWGMAPRGRQHRKNNMVGNTRMDAALDAMRQFGFEEQLVRETVEELLDVYEGTWLFIEEASYKLLIETILGKQQSSPEEKIKEDCLQDHARRDEVTERSSAATPTTGINEGGSSSLVVQDSLLQTSDGLDSAFQTKDQDPTSLGKETDVKDSTMPAERGHEQGIRVESKNNELKPADNVTGNNYNSFVGNVDSTFVRTPMIESSESLKNPPCRNRKPCYGWIDSDDEDVELTTFPLPPLPEHIEKLIGQSEAPQSGRRQRRKSRWDEKPDDM